MNKDFITTALARRAGTEHGSRIRAAVLGISLGVLSACGERVDGLPPVSLVGERAGALVWRAVPNATNYRMDILDSAGQVRIAHAAPDTFATLPFDHAVATGDVWWVRAYNGKKIIAASERARMY